MAYQTTYGASIYLTFAGKPLILSGVLSNKETNFEIVLPSFTLGEIINGIIHMVKPGYTLQFDAPWSYLLNENIDGLHLLLKVPSKESGKPIEFGIEYKKEITSIPGFTIKSMRIFARSIREVNFNMTGSLDFLGLSYQLDELFGKEGVNLLDPQGMPKPAPKPSLFKLNFLGVGQHLELQNAASYNHVAEVVDQLMELMQPPAPGTVVPAFTEALKFNNSSEWLFAIDAVIMDTVSFKIVFNDPALYGLFLSLHGEKAKVFKGLEFEILYKKITDEIGVYQIELKLPDAIRNLEFGAVSVTLPIVGIWIYTNGNFKIDLGFPYNNDFSRSFTVQAFPFTGAGGFYFAVLNGSTSLTVPQTNLGTFSPVLEFGVGLNLGLGKTFNKGILSAGLTIVFYGIVEGTLAWFTPNSTPVDPTATDFYYKLKGTFGIIGHIYGSVNFAIISATLDIVVYAQATITMEAAEPILLAFEAGVSIELTIKISLGFFSIRIHLSFSATVREQFTIGSPAAAQWKTKSLPAALYADSLAPVKFNWNNVVTLAAPQQLDLYFIPFFSVAKTAVLQQTVGVASLFAENNDQHPLVTYAIKGDSLNAGGTLTSFDKLCTGILAWAFSAARKSQTTSFAELLTYTFEATEIEQMLLTLDQSKESNGADQPFSYSQIINFIKPLFILNVIEIARDQTEEKTLPLTVFPIIPDLFLTDTAGNKIDFSTFNSVNESYMAEVAKLVAQFTDQDPNSVNALLADFKESMATLLFRDYFQLLAKSLLQAALDNMEIYTYVLPADKDQTLAEIAASFKVQEAAIVDANKGVTNLLAVGKNIIIPGTAHIIALNDTFASLQQLYDYDNTGNWNIDFINANLNVQLFKAGETLSIKGAAYVILPADTFKSIQDTLTLTFAELAGVIETNKTKPVLQGLTQIKLPYFKVAITKDDTFLSFTTIYGADLDVLAKVNREENILLHGATVSIANVQSLMVQDILSAVYHDNGFAKAGGSASRFALHGLRLPMVNADGSPQEKLEGLYELSGQQLNMPIVDDPEKYAYTLTISKTDPTGDTAAPAVIDWITFNGQNPTVTSLAYELTRSEIDRIKAFQTVDFAPKIERGPAPIQLYKDQNRVFAFANPISWSAFGKTPVPSIWNLPSSLRGIQNSQLTVDLKIAVQANASTGRTVSPLATDEYFYGTMVPITLKKVSNLNKEKINERSFEVFGTDATSVETLTALLRTDDIDKVLDSVTILYASNPGQDQAKALRSDDLSKALLLLINTNLSTETNPDSLLRAQSQQKITNTTPIDFISRLWKSSLVRTGGYYLYYDLDGETLPDSLFDNNGNGEVYLLIQYKSLPKNLVGNYMNIAGVYPTIDPSQALLFGEWNTGFEQATAAQLNQLLVNNQLVRNAIFKPGNIGFDLIRKNPDAQFNWNESERDNYGYELQQQYNLLNYAIKGDGHHFKALQSVTPVGPSNQDGQKEAWFYSKAMPISKLYIGKVTSAYTGLGESVAITFNWQDNYGNIFNSPLTEVNYRILYFDQLVPFAAWPSLTTDYCFFTPLADTNENFALTFHFIPGQNFSFDPNAKNPDAVKQAIIDQAGEYLKVYNGIQDQLVQADVSINLKVSLDPTALYPIAPAQQAFKNSVLLFVGRTIDWINLFLSDPVKYNQFQEEGTINPNSYKNNETFNLAVAPKNTLDIFPLAINVLVSRSTDLIDPQFVYNNNGTPSYAPGVQQITNAIKPKTTDILPPNEDNAPDQPLGLRNFALHFETAFDPLTFKLAATYIGEKSSTLTTTNNEELWVVRIKSHENETGIACAVNYDRASYYAPQPLANFLFTLPNVDIYPFAYYTGKEIGSTKKTFYGIDSEAWAIDFLQNVETILSSDLSLPITMVDHLNKTPDGKGILAHLLKAKQTVADAIALQTIPILINNDQNEIGLGIAAEKLKQQLLINLYNGYQINAVVQYQIDIESPYPNQAQPIAPNYYGKPFIKNNPTLAGQKSEPANNYAFSSAKIPLKNFGQPENPESYLTYTFESKTPSLSANVKLPIHYHITHAEYNIQKLKENGHHLPDDLTNYEISSWLNFIIPFDVAVKKEAFTTIPVPLRSYPQLPTFGSQVFDPKIKELDTQEVSIADAKLSSFTFDYTVANFVAQDSYHIEVYFNADSNHTDQLQDSKDISTKQRALFNQLAQFETVSEDFTNYFQTNLPQVNKDISDDALATLTKTLSAYGDLANNVSDAWLKLYTKDLKQELTASLEVITAKFELIERAVDPENKNSLFEIVISNWSVRSGTKDVSYVGFPDIKMDGWLPELQDSISDDKNAANSDPIIVRYYRFEDQEKQYLTFNTAIDIKSRSVSFKDLSVLLIQNAWAGLWIQRNAELSNTQKTAPEFVYATPLNRFNNPIMPAVTVSNTFELAPPSPSENTLKDYIQSLLAKLLLTPENKTVPASLKMLIQYQFTPSDDSTAKMPVITLPIALMPPTLFNEDDIKGTGTAVNALTETILNWFAATQPLLNDGKIIFSTFFYSNLTGATNSLPLLILENLEIDVNKVRL